MAAIFFTKDWNDVATCTTHIARELAKDEPVLWISSIGMRKPGARGAKDVRRILSRVVRGMEGAHLVEQNIHVLNPLVIPAARSGVLRKLNTWLIRSKIQRWMREQRVVEADTWAFVPNAIDFVEALPEGKLIYYCVDDWQHFEHIDTTWVLECEKRLLHKADVCFVASRYLEKMHAACGNVVYMPHGVDVDLFRVTTDAPAEIVEYKSPVIGFYGNLSEWVDLALISRLAGVRPDWTFLIVGPAYVDVSKLEALPNVLLPGRKDHHELPAYARAFDVGIIPYDMRNPRMASVNPVKVRELLSCGCPVVASRIPELEGMRHVTLCGTEDEWLAAMESMLAKGATREDVSATIKSDTWQERVSAMRSELCLGDSGHE